MEVISVILGGLPAQTLVTSLALLTGLSIYAFFHDVACDPLESGEIQSPNQVREIQSNTRKSRSRGFSFFHISSKLALQISMDFKA